jgi:hypothetical protein
MKRGCVKSTLPETTNGAIIKPPVGPVVDSRVAVGIIELNPVNPERGGGVRTNR